MCWTSPQLTLSAAKSTWRDSDTGPSSQAEMTLAAGFSWFLFHIKLEISYGPFNGCLEIGCLSPQRDILLFCTWLRSSLLPHRTSRRLWFRGGVRRQQVFLKLRGGFFFLITWVGYAWMQIIVWVCVCECRNLIQDKLTWSGKPRLTPE